MIWLTLALAADEESADTWDIAASHGATHDVSLDLTEGTWMSVSVHGDTVAFDLLGDIWTVPLSGGDATRVTEGAAWDAEPRFSPDGSTLAFVSDRDGNEQIWLMNADGSDPRKLTDESVARVTDAVWDPSGEWVVARRRTVDTRSIGVTELWQYHPEGGKGFGLTKLDAHPHAGESTLSGDGRFVFFSSRNGRFQYNHDPQAGLWKIVRLDRRNGSLHTVAYGAGSASRPLLSPDDSKLYFISRHRTDTVLEELILATGERRVVLRGLSRDELEGFALHGTYPAMDWTDAGELVLWTGGGLWRVDVASGEKTAIPFRAKGTWRLHDVQRWANPIEDTVRARVLRWPTVNPKGEWALSALGRVYRRDAKGTLDLVGPGFSPAWSDDGKTLLYTTWSDTEGGRVFVGKKELPLRGQLVNPAMVGDDVVVLRGAGGGTSRDLGDEPFFEIVHWNTKRKQTSVVTAIGNRGTASRATRLFLRDGRVYYLEDIPSGQPRTPPHTALVSIQLDGTDKKTHLKIPGAEEIVPSPDWRWVAYRHAHQLHVMALPDWTDVKPEQVPNSKVTTIVGDWIGWTPDSKAVTWAEGPVLKQKTLAAIFADPPPKGDQEPDPFAETDVDATEIVLELPRAKPEGSLVLKNARVITMNGDEILEGVDVVVEQDRITAIGADATVPKGAQVIDASGKTVIPGLVDVHAHLHYTAGDVLPEQEWRYRVNLDFGVTTVQDPSASTDLVFTQAERVAAGLMVGPRVYSTGYILYGALDNNGAVTPDENAARAHVRRLKAVGAKSVKVYQQSRRDARQWYVQACNEEKILCVPEGGGDLWMNLGMVADGFHALEHSLPTAPLHDDVIGFMSASKTDDSFGIAYSQTLLVAYGGLSGENWFYQHENPVDHPLLRRNYPARSLERHAWRWNLMARDDDWNFQQVAADAAKMSDKGLMLSMGAHGQLQGLGAHWELWAMGWDGALAPHDALRAATLNGARYLGIDGDVGSVETGKLADLVVLDADPLADLRNTAKIALVIANGEVVSRAEE